MNTKKKSSSKSTSSARASREVATEMRHMKEGRHSKTHPIKSRKQAIAVGLSKARAKGIRVPRRSDANAKMA